MIDVIEMTTTKVLVDEIKEAMCAMNDDMTRLQDALSMLDEDAINARIDRINKDIRNLIAKYD